MATLSFSEIPNSLFNHPSYFPSPQKQPLSLSTIQYNLLCQQIFQALLIYKKLGAFGPTYVQSHHPITNLSYSMASNTHTQSDFEDMLPIMAEKLGGEGLIGELCNGFELLMDGDKGVITFDSLKRNAAVLGLQGLSDGDLRSMLREGDLDGDGALNQMEFCVLMFRLSPDLMEQSEFLLEEALQQELKHFY
jgi:Ca2+-binding EF-hand superfamily protein